MTQRNTNLMPWFCVIVVITVLLCFNSKPKMMLEEEFELIQKINSAKTAVERERLTSKLEEMPVLIYPFYSRWQSINDVEPFDCWTEDRYDSALSTLPRDIQILAATSYGKSDIENGGFHQFFSNGTGAFAPEMIEWFERSNLHRTAAILKKAIAVFGDEFPRSQRARQVFLAKYPGNLRAEWDPFYAMDDEFYASLPSDEKVFDNAADRWLKEVCGIKNLHDRLESSENQ